MRRQKASSYYHQRTKNIIDGTYNNWQLTKTDEREGIHTLINRAVVAVSDLATEAKYIENKFFPDSMDVDEPWLLYKIEQTPGSLFLTSGDLTSSVLAKMKAASTLDNFFDGYFDTCQTVEEYTILSGETESISSIKSSVAHYSDELIVHKDNKYTSYDFSSNSISEGDLVIVASGTVEFYTDKNNRVIILDIDAPSDYVLIGENGNIIDHQLITKDSETGHYDANLDIDNNGVICQYEYDQFMKHYGAKMSDYTPSDWDTISWADVNKNDKIDETDLKSISAVSPALRSDILCAVCITDTYVGKVTLQYKTNPDSAEYLYRTAKGYSFSTVSSPYIKYGDICGYDEELSLYYTLDSATNRLHSVSKDGGLYSLLYIPGWSSSSRMIDIDFVDPFLYVLSYNGKVCRLYFSEMKSDSPTVISDYIEFTPEIRYGTPVKFTMSKDNTFLVLYTNTIIRYVLKRSTYFYSTNPVTTFFREKTTVFDATGTLIESSRHYVFNSFDSFAYSLGILRPYGVDNTGLRELIYDFFKYPQGHDKAGTSYGIMRELGYTNLAFNDASTIFSLPGSLTEGSTINVAGVTAVAENYPIVLSGICSINTTCITFTRDYLLSKSGASIIFSGVFDDEAGNSNDIALVFDFPEYANHEVVEVHSYRDTDYLNKIGYIVSGEPTEAFVRFVEDLEEKSAFTYANCIPDVSLFGSGRIPTVPRIPTIFDTIVRSSGNLEVIIE